MPYISRSSLPEIKNSNIIKMKPTEDIIIAQRIHTAIDDVSSSGRAALISFNIDTDRLFPCKCTRLSKDCWGCPRLQHRAAQLLHCMEALVTIPAASTFDFLGAVRHTIIMLYNNEYLDQVKRWFGLLEKLSLEQSTGTWSDEVEYRIASAAGSEARRFKIFRQAVQQLVCYSLSAQQAFVLLADLNVEWQSYARVYDELMYYGPIAEMIQASEPGEIHELSRCQMTSLLELWRVRREEAKQVEDKWGFFSLD